MANSASPLTVQTGVRSEDVTYTAPVVKIEARCTCGWKQLHENATNARFDADRHQHEWHGGRHAGVEVPDA